MPRSKMIEQYKEYLYRCYVPDTDGLIGEILDKFWTWKLDRMTEGEILDRYYEITNKPREYRTEGNDYE